MLNFTIVKKKVHIDNNFISMCIWNRCLKMQKPRRPLSQVKPFYTPLVEV